MRILVVDDHHLIREGLRPLLEQVASDEPVHVLEAATLADALRIVASDPELDLALVDLNLPDAMGVESVSSLRARHPALPLVVMSGDDSAPVVREALDRGALGFIPKSSAPAVIVGALRLVLAGGTYIPREAMQAHGVQDPPTARVPELGLTPRQMDVLRLILAGKSNKVIGRELDLAEGTVKNHVAAVLKALEVTTRTQAVIAAAQRGIKA